MLVGLTGSGWYKKLQCRSAFSKPALFFFIQYALYISGNENIIDHYTGNDHKTAESVDDDIFPMFFEKIAHSGVFSISNV